MNQRETGQEVLKQSRLKTMGPERRCGRRKGEGIDSGSIQDMEGEMREREDQKPPSSNWAPRTNSSGGLSEMQNLGPPRTAESEPVFR